MKSSWPEVPRNAAILLTDANSDLQISVHSLLGSSRLREHAHTWFASWIIYFENRDPGLDVWKPPSNYIQHHQQFNIRLYFDQVSNRIEMFRENCGFLWNSHQSSCPAVLSKTHRCSFRCLSSASCRVQTAMEHLGKYQTGAWWNAITMWSLPQDEPWSRIYPLVN
jgi:hypothetical protein